MVVGWLCFSAAPALAAFTASPVPDVFQDGRPAVPGVLMTGDAASDTLTITIGDSVLSHDRFGVDPGFASAEDFDTTQPGTQTFPSSFANLLMVDGGAGQDSLRFVDARPDYKTNWLHHGAAVSCVDELGTTASTTELCYRAPTVEAVTLDGGPGNDQISSLDSPPTTPLTLAGGDGDDSLSQDGPDGVHVLASPVSLIGGAGSDEAALTEDQTGHVDYTVGNGQIQGTGYAPVSYDDTDEYVTVYTRFGPDNTVTITEQSPHSITVWSAGGAVDARGAGPETDVLARPSLFVLDDQGPIDFHGGPADDIFFGTTLNDRAAGGGGDDQLNGDNGNDRLNGGPGADFLNGESGKDRISARDHTKDAIDCGAQRDKAKVDKHEGSLKGCEVLNKPH
jgi:Ca2+-binding RTX toxin-like protein